MDFDDVHKIQVIDQDGMIVKICEQAKQIQSSWSFVQLQQNFDFPHLKHIYVGGMTTRLNAIDILRVMMTESYSVGLSVHENGNLPLWCQGKDYLLLLVVDQATAEEMADLLEQGIKNECSIFILFADQRTKNNFSTKSIDHWVLPDHKFDRTTLGFDAFILYGILFKFGLVSDITQDIPNLKLNLETTIQHIDINVPSALNPAKRLAGQMVGRWVKIVAGGVMLPIANQWSDQINQSAKTLSNSENIYHLAHCSLSGFYNPENVTQKSMVVFLKSCFNDQKIERMMDRAKEELMCNGIGTDSYSARGEDLLSQIWTTILFGDFLAYYLAIAYECDPTPIATLS
jgi:glucose/mannose-6-phosphate isomerase